MTTERTGPVMGTEMDAGAADTAVFATAPDGRPLYRRRHAKADGRDILLYGYVPPMGSPLHGGLDAAPGQSALRWHPLRGEWSVYAAARQNRTYKPNAVHDPLAPAAPGRAETEIPFADFELAVFANRFPSFRAAPGEPGAPIPGVQQVPAHGHCDVVVYAPEPDGSLATLSQERRVLLVHAWIDRYRSLFEAGFDTVLPFENRGEEVGVTLHHPHGQIYAFGFTPSVQARAVKAFEDGYDLAGYLNDWHEDYHIVTQGGIAAIAPPFARFPYEVWLIPSQPRRGPWDFTWEEVDGFAAQLGEITRRYDALFGRACPFMLSLHAAPASAGWNFQFTAQFYPLLRSADKVKYLASVEQATGVFTVDIMPEQAAHALRGL